MTAFSVSNHSAATVDADPATIWGALTDPDLLPRLTPYLRSIEADGDRWVWHLTRIPILGRVVAPSFTEVMTFDEPTVITFSHDPAHTEEKAGVEGRYDLTEGRAGTDLSIDLAITIDLPFPALAAPGVHAAMKVVVAGMGRRFSANLVRHVQGS